MRGENPRRAFPFSNLPTKPRTQDDSLLVFSIPGYKTKDFTHQTHYNRSVVITLKVTNVRLSNKIITEIDTLAKKHGLSRSEVIRQSLVVYLHLVENVGTMLRPIAFRIKPVQIAYLRRGDVSILKIPTGHAIVIGSTSSGGVGPKPMDEVKVEEGF